MVLWVFNSLCWIYLYQRAKYWVLYWWRKFDVDIEK